MVWECPVVHGPCTRGASPWCGDCKGEIAKPAFIGLTRRALLYIHSICNKMRIEDIRSYGMLLGVQFADDPAEELSPEDIARRATDPLFDWPNDITFYTSEEISILMEKSKKVYNKYLGGKLKLDQEALDALWMTERQEAALGDDIVAKRASNVTPLWLKYLGWKREHGRCSLDRLKWFVEVDVARSKFYPLSSIPEQDKLLKERYKYEKENDLPVSLVSDKIPPPGWYMDHLKAVNKLEPYKKAMEVVFQRKVKD